MKTLDKTSIIEDLQHKCDMLHNQIIKMQEEYKVTVSQISHEIRNPVTLVSSSLQLIEKEHPEVTKYAFWKETMSDIKYLCELLDELSSYNNGNALNIAPISTVKWLHEIAASFLVMNASKRIAFYYNIDPSLPTLMGDAIKLKQVIINLLRNAAESIQDKGSISFICSLQQNELCLESRDTGCGIPEEHMKEIYNPFFTNKKGGSGLGLSISKRIIDAHHGRIICNSKSGIGTVFTIYLPLSSR